eukprot:TRINITY_DN2187_c2_g1_i1.p1 TRINITY_DN2187_c2_g1~~TRINITY_DN2187_c2_g1_i1.p1  ORF type:complete len:360 (+),score=114.11 TRINITY_DN2187_c2_g1_i1:43-1122(+)
MAEFVIVGGGILLLGSAAVGVGSAVGIGTGGILYYKKQKRKLKKRRYAKKPSDSLFGGLLETTDRKYFTDTYVPKVLVDCTEYILNCELEDEEIVELFNKKDLIVETERLEELKNIYENDDYEEFDIKNEDIEDVLSLFFLFLKCMPEPLFTLVFYKDFIDQHQKYSKKKYTTVKWAGNISNLIRILPEINFRISILIFSFFKSLYLKIEDEESQLELANILAVTSQPYILFEYYKGMDESLFNNECAIAKDLIYKTIINLDFFQFPNLCDLVNEDKDKEKDDMMNKVSDPNESFYLVEDDDEDIDSILENEFKQEEEEKNNPATTIKKKKSKKKRRRSKLKKKKSKVLQADEDLIILK